MRCCVCIYRNIKNNNCLFYTCIGQEKNKTSLLHTTEEIEYSLLKWPLETIWLTLGDTPIQQKPTPTTCKIAQSNVLASLAAVLICDQSYTEARMPWLQSVYSWCLSRDVSSLQLRSTAWLLLPFFCLYSRRILHKDGYVGVGGKSLINVDDHSELLEAVAIVIGHVACARSGMLLVLADSISILSTVAIVDNEDNRNTGRICDFYRCTVCDSHSLEPSETWQADTTTLSLSDWLPYWFITSSKQHETTSMLFLNSVCQFVRHAPPEDMFLDSSPLGQATKRRLSSSNRELRLAAKSAMLAYSQDHPFDNEEVRLAKQQNRTETMFIILEMEKETQEPSILCETLQIMAGGVGCECQLYEASLGGSVSFLVDYYCRENVFLRAVAMEQLLLVAQGQKLSLSRLLSICSESIACVLANTLAQPAPQPFAHCMQMLETTPKHFLTKHQDVIVPHLIASGNELALRRVADIMEMQMPVLCVNKAAVVFVKIFLVDDQLMHQAMLRYVRLISTGSEMDVNQVEVNIPILLKTCTVQLVFYLVLSLGEDYTILRRRARSALLTVQHIMKNSGTSPLSPSPSLADTTAAGTFGVATIVQQSVNNMKGQCSESPRSSKASRQQALSTTSTSTGNVELADFLSQHLLGVLAYINELLRDSSEHSAIPNNEKGVEYAVCNNEPAKLKALKAIKELVKLLGAKAMPFITNIVASLIQPLQNASMAQAALSTWDELINSLSREALSADQLNCLVIPLITLFVRCGETSSTRTAEAASAINQIYHLHEHSLQHSLPRLCPIPNDPMLAESYGTYQRLSTKYVLYKRVSYLQKLLKSNDATMVLCASNELCRLLQQNDKTLAQWKQKLLPAYNKPNVNEMLSSSSRHGAGSSSSSGSGGATKEMMFSLVESLNVGCEVNGYLKVEAAASCTACLAVIGVISQDAIDSNIENNNSSNAKASSTFYNLEDDKAQVNLVLQLIIDHLSLAFASAPSPNAQGCAAYAIQELLPHIGYTKDLLYPRLGDSSATATISSSGFDPNRLKRRQNTFRSEAEIQHEEWLVGTWNTKVPQHVVDIIWPLLDTKYAIQSSNRLDKPAPNTRRASCVSRSPTHINWLRHFVIELATILPSTPKNEMFKLCISAMKEGTVDMLLLLLSPLAYQYCFGNQPPQQQIKGWSRHNSTTIMVDDDSDEEMEDLDSKTQETNVVVDEIMAVLDSDANLLSVMPVEQLRLCKETALDLLDGFGTRLRRLQKTRTDNKRETRKDSKLTSGATLEELALSSLVESVPHRHISQAAAFCFQYERAILHSELALREGNFGNYPTLFGNVDDPAITSIQELYLSMEDVDGVTGAAACCKQVDHKMTIRQYEIEGNWSHALIGHDSLLRSKPDSLEYQKGWISCLQNMGQWEGAWAASKELFRASTGDDQSLTSACFAAAWRLGKWDWIDNATTPVGASFDVVNSSLLLQLWKNRIQNDKSALLPPQMLASSHENQTNRNSSLKDLVALACQIAGNNIGDSATLIRHIRQGNSNQAVDLNVIQTHMLGDIVSFASYMTKPRLVDGLGKLVENWRMRILHLPPVYSVQEPVLALHGRMLDTIRNSMVNTMSSQSDSGYHDDHIDIITRQTMRTHLQAAQLARLAGFKSTALGILIHSELTCSDTLALLAPLQIERAQILWDEGHSSDAMSLMKRIANNLWDGLGMGNAGGNNNEADGGASLTFNRANSSGSGLSASLMKDGSDINNGGSRTQQSAQDIDDIKSAFAKSSLLLSKWQEETNAVTASTLLNRYERIVRVEESDKVHYALGHLYDKLFTALGDKDPSKTPKSQQDHRNLQVASLQYYVIRHYSRTIICSSRFLFQALPRLVTVWLDFGNEVMTPALAKHARVVERFKQGNRIISNMSKRLPAYNFLVVLSQLVSRICHVHDDVFEVLEGIILRVLEMYPQQTLWQLMGVQRSTFEARRERCETILSKARSDAMAGRNNRNVVGISDLIQQAAKLTDLLLGLCNASPSSRTVTTMYMNADFKTLAKNVPLDIIVPLEKCLVPTLPDTTSGAEYELALSSSSEFADNSNGTSKDSHYSNNSGVLHQPFSGDLPTISGFTNEIEVMNSLQRPKKITIKGSDGQQYSFLCKPKDDLRKDARLMEFNAMINQLLATNPKTQKQGLKIRTYAVVPLNEECGLIEWVGSTTGIRHVLLKLYKAHGVTFSVQQIKKILDKTNPSPEELFTKSLLPMFPSVLHEWFLNSFPNPVSWLESRANFTRSVAVMSMVGHILGLGDRHCENILMDESTGGVMHVDFNCLFEKGMTLEKPEKVPFRLTHNMVDAMGVTGYEGVFRKTCEMTLSLLREHRDALMSVLETFLHDPLVEWSKRVTRASRGTKPGAGKDLTAANQPNEQATRCLHTINRKLQGILQGVVPLSVEGQVDELIREATDPKRLFQMYIGWAAYM